MIKVRNIDHVAIALPDLGPAASLLTSLFQLQGDPVEHVTSQQVDVQFLFPPDDMAAGTGGTAHSPRSTALELVSPGQNPGLQAFIAKRGSALHHVCFQVDDLASALQTLKGAGVPLVDEKPRPGARGHLVAFIHPSATGGVLFELCQHVSPGDSLT